ncbi:hypothetical protein SK224_04405 [Microbacterium sp. BG28]|uniref:aggregation-promoting factor C-terminal-like domain-containing protein n=1 Tax=Microbacterium sp. BG28 TaxID=3097356 RepID=UPI002A5A5D26|nr:hypothetical protein [Microbacterium sp. BG28]MDY0828365.1 hypothetical protein [Microbacterium sp. BG28]
MPRLRRALLSAAALVVAVPLLLPTAAFAASDDAAPTPTPSVSTPPADPAPRTIDLDASLYLTLARSVSASAAGKADTTTLDKEIARLSSSTELSDAVAEASITVLRDATSRVTAERDAYDARVAAEQQAAAEAAAAAIAQANTPDGARAAARTMAAENYGWGDDQFSCLESLWQRESSWNYQAYNDGSGATGIPQALPGSKMASAGDDWQTNAITQIRWGLDYIDRAYGTPCAAWGHSQATSWY